MDDRTKKQPVTSRCGGCSHKPKLPFAPIAYPLNLDLNLTAFLTWQLKSLGCTVKLLLGASSFPQEHHLLQSMSYLATPTYPLAISSTLWALP